MSTAVTGEVRWGVIGAGDVVQHKSGPALAGVKGSRLVAVMRRDPARAAEMAALLGADRWYDDADALVADPEVDAVYVATPPDTHAEHTLRAAAAGKPVYVEKPMARTAAECRRMIDDCAAAGVPLHVAYYRRALPRFVAAADAIRSGRLGEVRSVVVRLRKSAADAGWRVRPEVSGGGHFVDLASHTLDWLDHVLGPVVAVSGDADGDMLLDGVPSGAETRVAGTFRFGGGALGVGVWDFETSEDLDVIELVGSEGTLRMSSFGEDHPLVTTATGAEELVSQRPPVVQWPMIENVVASLQGRADPLSTGESALRTAVVVDTLLAGHRERRGIDSASW